MQKITAIVNTSYFGMAAGFASYWVYDKLVCKDTLDLRKNPNRINIAVCARQALEASRGTASSQRK